MREDVALVLPNTTPLPEIVQHVPRHPQPLPLRRGRAGERCSASSTSTTSRRRLAERELSSLVIAEDLIVRDPLRHPVASRSRASTRSSGSATWASSPSSTRPETRRFLGIVTRRDLLGAFDREVLQRSRLLARVRTLRRAGGREWTTSSCRRSTASSRWTCRPAIEGRTVGEAGMRSRFGVSVLAVKRLTREGLERRFVPGRTDRFQHGDVLIVLGTEDAIDEATVRQGLRGRSTRTSAAHGATKVRSYGAQPGIMAQSKESEFVALRGKWQKERIAALRPGYGPAHRRRADRGASGDSSQNRGSIAALIFRPGSEGNVEAGLGLGSLRRPAARFRPAAQGLSGGRDRPLGDLLPSLRPLGRDHPHGQPRRAARSTTRARSSRRQRSSTSSSAGISRRGPTSPGGFAPSSARARISLRPQAPRRAADLPGGPGRARPGHPPDRARRDPRRASSSRTRSRGATSLPSSSRSSTSRPAT